MEFFTSEEWEARADIVALPYPLPPADGALNPVPTDLTPVLKPLEGIRIVIFDIYGTLIISRSGEISTGDPDGSSAFFRKTFEAFELFPLNLAEKASEIYLRLIRESHAESRKNGIESPEVDILSIWHGILLELEPMFNKPVEITSGLAAGMAVCYESLQNETAPMPGLLPLLSKLKQNRIRAGIISNAQFYTPALLRHYLGRDSLERLFEPELQIWSYREKEAKPSLRLFQKAGEICLENWECEPHQILYVGNDMRNDIFPAHRTGMKTALFAGDRRSLRLREKDPLYSYIKPDIIITELEQLSEILFF